MTEADIKWNFTTNTDKHGRVYVITYYNRWDPEKKQSRIAKRMHVGRLDTDTGEITFSKRYLELFPQFLCKTMFYENNKLVERSEEEIDKLKAAKTEHDFSFRCDSLSVGLTSACWTMALQSGITAALEEVFGKDGLELLRLGIYELCSHGEAMQNYEDWLCMNYLPGAKQLSSQQISDLLSKVNQEQIDQYFKMRYDRIAGKYQSRIEESLKNAPTLNPMTIAIDSTSIATYSESIGDAACLPPVSKAPCANCSGREPYFLSDSCSGTI